MTYTMYCENCDAYTAFEEDLDRADEFTVGSGDAFITRRSHLICSQCAGHYVLEQDYGLEGEKFHKEEQGSD